MRRTIKRLAAVLFLGLALALGMVGSGDLAQPAPAVSCGLGGCSGGGGGG